MTGNKKESKWFEKEQIVKLTRSEWLEVIGKLGISEISDKIVLCGVFSTDELDEGAPAPSF